MPALIFHVIICNLWHWWNLITSRLLAVLKYLVIICVSPFSLLFIGCVINQILAGFNDNLVSLLGKAWVDFQDGLMVSAFQFYLSDNWTFPLLNFVFLPIWSLFWFIATVNDWMMTSRQLLTVPVFTIFFCAEQLQFVLITMFSLKLILC